MTAVILSVAVAFSLVVPDAGAVDGGVGGAAIPDASMPDARNAASPPVPLLSAQPVYPAAARAAGRQGVVIVRLEIDETGAVASAEVVSGADPELDAAALEAARSLRFQPARQGDQAIRAIVDWRIEFKLRADVPRVEATPAAGPAPAPDVAADKRGHIEGRVLAKGTRRPISGATVNVDLDAIGETGADGRFAADVPCGSRHVDVQAPGFDIVTVERDPCRDPSPLLIRLPPHDQGPHHETIVRPRTSVPAQTVQQQELTKTPGSLGDPFRVVESLPGVSAVAWPAPVYAVRGANPGNTGFFLDDLRIPALFHLLLGPSVIHPYFFGGLDFYPGGYPARYGRYVAGIVAAQTKQPPSDMVHATADVRLFDAGALVSVPFPDGNGSLAVAARYSYTAAVISLMTDAVRLDYWDYQVRADRNLGSTRLTLLAFGSSDLFSPSGANASNRELVLRFHRLGLRSATPIGRGSLTASLALGADHSKAPLADVFPLTIDSVGAAPRLAFRWPTTHVDLEVGFDGELQRFSPATTIQRPGVLDLVNKRDARLLAGYASVMLRAGPQLTLTPEVRLDTYAVGAARRADVGPRASARLALDQGTIWIVGAGGRFTQTPSLPLQIPGAESFALALYGLQSSWQGSLGIGTTRIGGLESTVTGFVQRYVLTDVRDPTLSMVDPLAPDFLARRDALSYGLEVMLRRPPSERLHGWLAYTLSRNLRALGGGVIAPSDWDQRHILNLVVGYRIGKYTLGGRAHLNTGRPVPITQSGGQSFGRLPTYYQIDLRADRRFVFDAFALEVYAELVNATFSRQVVTFTRDYTGNVHGDDFRIVLPSIGVHGEF